MARADALCAQYLTQGWNLRDASQPTAAPDTESAILSVWFAAPNWEVTGVQCQETAEISPSAIMGKPPLGRLLSPELVSTVEAALAAAATGSRQVLYFKAIRDGGRVDFRRGVLFGDSERVRMDVFETTEAVAGRSAVEVDLRA